MNSLFGGVFGSIYTAWPHIAEKQDYAVTIRRTTKEVFGHALLFATVATVFTSTQCTLESLREHDRWNNIIAGCATGTVVGLRTGSIGKTVGGCVGLGAVMAIDGLRNGNDAGEKSTATH